MIAITNSVASDLRSLALYRLLLAIAVAFNGIVFEAPLAWLVLVPAVTLFFGYRTSWSVFACWLSFAVLHSFDPATIDNADLLLVALLLLSIFLPIGACYSVDSALDLTHAPDAPASSNTSETDPYHVSTATVALTMIMLFTVVLAAVNSFDQFGAQPFIVRALNLIALAAPVPILLTGLNGWLRVVALVTLTTALIAAMPFLERGLVPLTVVAGLVALLPACIWNWLSVVLNLRRRSDIRIYFDLDCGFCRKTCYLFRTFLMLGDASILPAQSDEDVYRIMQQEVSWVVYDYDGEAFIRWNAVLLLLRRSPVLWPVGWLLTGIGMGYWGDPIYRLIGASRWSLSKLTAVILPYRRERTPAGIWVTWLIGFWLISGVAVTAGLAEIMPDSKMLDVAANMLGLDQRRPAW